MMELDIILNLLRESNLNNVEALVARLAGIGLTIAIVRAVRKGSLIPDSATGGWKSSAWALGLSIASCVMLNMARMAVNDPAVWWQILPLESTLTWLGAMGAWSGGKAVATATGKVVSSFA